MVLFLAWTLANLSLGLLIEKASLSEDWHLKGSHRPAADNYLVFDGGGGGLEGQDVAQIQY